MPDSYFAGIPFANDTTLNALQGAMSSFINDMGLSGMELIPAPLWHITLVYATNMDRFDLREIAGAFSFQQSYMYVDSWGYFSNEEDSLVLMVYRSEPLIALQMLLSEMFTERGVISEYSVPMNYTPHITLATFPKGTLNDTIIQTLNAMITPSEMFGILADRVVFSVDDYSPVAITTAIEYKLDKGLSDNAKDIIQILTGASLPDTTKGSGFKAINDNQWVAWYTNNFKDREGEIISIKALRDFTDKANRGDVPMPELWFHHIKGTRHGVAEALFLSDHTAIAVGVFDDPAINKFVSIMKSWYDKQQLITVSHGFEYELKHKQGNVYNRIRTYEISSLPVGREANSMTRFITRGQDEHFKE